MTDRSLVYSVSQLNYYVKSLLDGDPKLKNFLIQGEISNFTAHYQSGHFYFTIKDEKAAVKAVMFQSYASRVKFTPKNGLKVIAVCSLSVYERDGVYQLYVYDLMPEGEGALSLAFQQRKDKLEKAGLFDEARKRPIPTFPLRVGVITSENGAALQDILHILERRNPLIQVFLFPVQVQGETAAPQMIKALRALNQDGRCDVILIGRGGGSMEDLWAFNDEDLAHEIYHSQIPVISGVGHETDFTICDFVSDLRAPTPSAAAELCTLDLRLWLQQLKNTWLDKGRELYRQMESRQEQIAALRGRLESLGPVKRLEQYEVLMGRLRAQMTLGIRRKLQWSSQSVLNGSKLLEAYSPMKVIARGYAVVRRGDHVVADGRALCPGDRIVLQMRDATVSAQVDGVDWEDEVEKKS